MAHDIRRHLRVPGIIFAELYGRCVSAEHDLEGLLFGSVSRRTVHSVDDESSNVQTILANVLIDEFLPTGATHSFYDPHGAVNISALEKAINAQSSQGHEFLGWFKFRRNFPHRPTLLDATIQRELTQYWRKTDARHRILSSPYFGMFGLTETLDSGLRFDYRFFMGAPLCSGTMTTIEIINLVNSSSSEYAELANAQSPFKLLKSDDPAQETEDAFTRLSKQIQSSMPSSFGTTVPPPYVQETERFFVTTMRTMNALVDEISSKEHEIKRLERELDRRKAGSSTPLTSSVNDLLLGD